MKYELDLTTKAIEKFCREFNCSKNDIDSVIVSYLNDDTESRFYREMNAGNFDIDEFLLSHPPAVLLTMRANAMTKRKKFIEDDKGIVSKRTKD